VAASLGSDAPSVSGADAAAHLWELHSAEATERRALAIQEWPFDKLLARVIAIVSSVGTAILTRLILGRIGL
jgi:hypothetical protein